MKTIMCYICGINLLGMGNNPYSVKEQGICCDTCNIKHVIPARITAIGGSTVG